MVSFGVVKYYGSYGKSTCSYCKSTKESSESVGMRTFNISGPSYQWLIDRGWRRSGTYCYKMLRTDCCAFYTIRCDALKFEVTRSKRKLLSKMNKFLQAESIEQVVSYNKNGKKRQPADDPMDCESQAQLKNQGSKVDFNLNNISDATDTPNSNSSAPAKHDTARTPANQPVVNDHQQLPKTIEIEQLKQSSKQKAGRILRRIEKIKNKLNCTEQHALDLISERKRRRVARTAPGRLPLEEHLSKENGLRNELKIKIVPADRESGRQSHELYKKYQKIIHQSEDDELTYRNFERFLVSSPFPKNQTPDWAVPAGEQLPDRYGCFHMQYWLNGQLIGVNVIDILPACVSSVYFFYDPDYSFLNLGTYSSLREIELVRKLYQHQPSIEFYYMGFYIHSCVKMRYKGNINASYLLCPETFIFHDYKWCKANFDLSKTNRLTLDSNVSDSAAILHVDDVLVLARETAMSYLVYRSEFGKSTGEPEAQPQRELVEEYAKLVGNKFIFKNLIYLD